MLKSKFLIILIIFISLSIILSGCKPKTEECIDSDGGQIYDVKGAVTYQGKTYEDTCRDANNLVENYCLNNKQERVKYRCNCVDGACTGVTGGGGGTTCVPSTEICDGIDNNCDNIIDEGCMVTPAEGFVGFGAISAGGLGGNIYKVTSLADSGSGTLIECAEATGKRICVFEISGTINLAGNDLTILNPYISIYGQTAPGNILLKGGTLIIQTNDVIIQHIAVRPGADYGVGDAISIGDGAKRVVIDHVSTSWGTDENFGINANANGIEDITISNSIISEVLRNSINPEGAHSRGMLINSVRRISVINNLFAHNVERNPNLVISEAEAINNLIYNWGTYGTRIRDGLLTAPNVPSTIPVKVSVIGNVYIDGPDTQTGRTPINFDEASGANTFRIGAGAYLYDNMDNGIVPSDPWSTTLVSFDVADTSRVTQFTSPPVQSSELTIMPSSQVESYVLANVGSHPNSRDVIDSRIINEVVTKTGKIIDSVDEGGGYPNIPIVTKALDVSTDDFESWLKTYTEEVE